MSQFLDRVALVIDNVFIKIKIRAMRSRLTNYPNIHSSVILGPSVQLLGPNQSFNIGKGTYINDAIISTGSSSKVMIGNSCAIGYRVSIKALTHDVKNPCPNEQGITATIEKDINIGNNCWIGDNVYIREGVTLGNDVSIGANSVVTKSFPDNVVIAGVPAVIISK